MSHPQAQFTGFFVFEGVRARAAHAADVDELVALINPAYSYQDTAKGEPRTNHNHLTKRMTEVEFFVFENDAGIQSCIYIEPKEDSLHFGLLTVVPQYRGKGLALAIMTAIDKYAAACDHKYINLDYVSLAPWLKKYYERLGYEETGNVVHRGTIDLIAMQKQVGVVK